MIKKKTARLIFVLALLATFILGVGVRRTVYNAQSAPGWDEMPFTMESALHFRLIRMLVEDGTLPSIDRHVQHPEGVRVSETYSLSDEYLLAGLLRVVPDFASLAERVRWISLLWFCLTIPALAGWIAAPTRSRWSGLVGALFYAVMIAAVIRSTGQEISRENFAMPLLVGHLALGALASASNSRKSGSLLAAASGLLLGLAWITWDLIQFYVLIVWLIAALRILANLLRKRSPELRAPSPVEIGVLLAVVICSPYQRAHGIAFSPLFLLGCGILLTQLFTATLARRRAAALSKSFYSCCASIMMIAPFSLFLLDSGSYADHYGHFGRLLIAKLRHCNIKPADPALLDFDARIMWVPALHSASSETVFILLPAILLLTLPLFLLLCRTVYRGGFQRERIFDLVVLYLTSFIAFLLFVRFHVFFALFAAALLGVGSYYIMRNIDWKTWVWAVLLLLVFLGEARHTLGDPTRWGRPMVYYSEMKELIDWSYANIEAEPVVANFGLSATVLTYAGNPIVLHPKFESARIRGRVREYAELLFKGDERALRDWMEEMDARYLIYSMGEFSDAKVEWQMRYFVDAINPPASAPARYFEKDDAGLSLFQLVWQNRKYKVFRLITSEDEQEARQLVSRAREHLQSGRLQAAQDDAARALLIDPNQDEAARVLRHAGALMDQGFGEGQGE